MHQSYLVEHWNIQIFKQFMKENNRVTQMTATILDLIFTNRPELILSSSVNDVRISDHCLISSVLEIKKIKPKSHVHEYRDTKNYNIDTLTSIYQKINQVDSENISPKTWQKIYKARLFFHSMR